jgi:hypothetical protein
LSLAALTVAGTTVVTVVAAILLHHESGHLLSGWMARSHWVQRKRILLLLFALLAVHVLTIWLFGLALYLLSGNPEYGALVGYSAYTLPDYVYLSAVTYTTVGYGDLVPHGHIRFLLGTEALTGFLLITWSASLSFLEMQRHWPHPRGS